MQLGVRPGNRRDMNPAAHERAMALAKLSKAPYAFCVGCSLLCEVGVVSPGVPVVFVRLFLIKYLVRVCSSCAKKDARQRYAFGTLS